MDDNSKVIAENILWEKVSGLQAWEFKVEVNAANRYPIFVKGWYNPNSGKLSYSVIYRGVGRIYGLDLGAQHRNPNRELIGEKHKHYWKTDSRDKHAYIPNDISATWDQPEKVWKQFCAEMHLGHSGVMQNPIIQEELPL